MAYVDGYVAAVPVASREAYVRWRARWRRSTASMARWRRSSAGATTCRREAHVVSDGGEAGAGRGGGVLVDPLSVAGGAGCGQPEVMAEPLMQGDRSQAPFDAKRMIYGGFEVLVER